jgi:hypothetical protein
MAGVAGLIIFFHTGENGPPDWEVVEPEQPPFETFDETALFTEW